MLACFRHNAAERRQRSHLSLRWMLPRDTHPRVPCVFLTKYLFWVIYLHVPRHWPDVPVQRPISIEKFRHNVAQALDRTTTQRHNLLVPVALASSSCVWKPDNPTRAVSGRQSAQCLGFIHRFGHVSCATCNSHPTGPLPLVGSNASCIHRSGRGSS